MTPWSDLTPRSPLAPWLSSVLARNAGSSFVALGWLSLLMVVALPLYIRLLGASEWGLVAACTSLQLLFYFVDSGFSQVVLRWVARDADHAGRLRAHVAVFRNMYLGLGLLVFLLLQLGAPFLAQSWFQVPDQGSHDLVVAIRIIAFQMLFQFLNSLHTSVWLGLQLQVRANLSACGFGTLKHLLTLAVLFWGPALAWAYAASFALVALLELCTNAWLVRRLLVGLPLREAAPALQLRPFFKDVALLSGGIVVGLAVSQLDRLVLSRSLPLEDFGVYTAVLTLALAFLQLQAPFTKAIFPLLVQDIALGGRPQAKHLLPMVLGTLVVATLPALLAAEFAAPLLSAWLRSPVFVELGQHTFALLLWAVAINSVYGCMYQVILAAGHTHWVLKTNALALAAAVAVVLVAPSLGLSDSLQLGGVVWLANSLTQLAMGVLWVALHGFRPAGFGVKR